MKEVSRKKSTLKMRVQDRMHGGDELPMEVREKAEAASLKVDRSGGVDKWELKQMVNKLKRKAEGQRS